MPVRGHAQGPRRAPHPPGLSTILPRAQAPISAMHGCSDTPHAPGRSVCGGHTGGGDCQKFPAGTRAWPGNADLEPMKRECNRKGSGSVHLIASKRCEGEAALRAQRRRVARVGRWGWRGCGFKFAESMLTDGWLSQGWVPNPVREAGREGHCQCLQRIGIETAILSAE